jgi:hypothetical protein
MVSALPSFRSDRGAASFLITGTDCAADSRNYYDYLHIDHDHRSSYLDGTVNVGAHLQHELADHSLDQALPLLQTLGSNSCIEDQSRINDANILRDSAADLHLDPKYLPIVTSMDQDMITSIPAHDRSLLDRSSQPRWGSGHEISYDQYDNRQYNNRQYLAPRSNEEFDGKLSLDLRIGLPAATDHKSEQYSVDIGGKKKKKKKKNSAKSIDGGEADRSVAEIGADNHHDFPRGASSSSPCIGHESSSCTPGESDPGIFPDSTADSAGAGIFPPRAGTRIFFQTATGGGGGINGAADSPAPGIFRPRHGGGDIINDMNIPAIMTTPSSTANYDDPSAASAGVGIFRTASYTGSGATSAATTSAADNIDHDQQQPAMTKEYSHDRIYYASAGIVNGSIKYWIPTEEEILGSAGGGARGSGGKMFNHYMQVIMILFDRSIHHLQRPDRVI